MNTSTSPRQRRSGRFARQLPIQVSGIDAMGRDFTSPARTLMISRYGAEILLKNELVPDQEVSVCLLGTFRDWDARVVGLYSKRPEGYAYGIEFLFQDGNFWGISFPPGPGAPAMAGVPQETAKKSEADVVANRCGTAEESALDAILKPVRRAGPSRTFAVRLKCPHLEAHNAGQGGAGGSDDQWLILQDRRESLQQILETCWDFTCPIHGAQREYPLEAKETGSNARICLDPERPTRTTGTVGASQPESPAPKARREKRSPQTLRVWVRGMDLNGNSFRQSALSLDISRSGARLDGLGLLTLPGTTIEVRRNWRKALFRVVWTGKKGTPQATQIGIVCLEPHQNVWNIPEEN